MSLIVYGRPIMPKRDAGEYTPIDLRCRHCGEKLSARSCTVRGPVIWPAHTILEYVHTHDGRAECATVHDAAPYDGFEAVKVYQETERKERS